MFPSIAKMQFGKFYLKLNSAALPLKSTFFLENFTYVGETNLKTK